MANNTMQAAPVADPEANGLVPPGPPARMIRSVRRLAIISAIATVLAFVSTPLPILLVPLFVVASFWGFRAAKTANMRHMKIFGACNAVFAVMAVIALLFFLPTAIPTVNCACDSTCVDAAFLEANTSATFMQQARFEMMSMGMDGPRPSSDLDGSGDRWSLRGPAGPSDEEHEEDSRRSQRPERGHGPRSMEAAAPAKPNDAPPSAPAPAAPSSASAPASQPSHEELEAERREGEEAARHRRRPSRRHDAAKRSHDDSEGAGHGKPEHSSDAGAMLGGKYHQQTDGGNGKYNDEGDALWRGDDEDDDNEHGRYGDDDDDYEDEDDNEMGASMLAGLFATHGGAGGRRGRRHGGSPSSADGIVGVPREAFDRFAHRVCSAGPGYITAGVVGAIVLAILHFAAALSARRLARHPWFIQQDALRRASHPAYSAPAAVAAMSAHAPQPQPQQGMAVPVTLAPMPVSAGNGSGSGGLGSLLRSAWQSVAEVASRSRQPGGYAPVHGAGTAIQQDEPASASAPMGIATASADPQPMMVVAAGPAIAGNVVAPITPGSATVFSVAPTASAPSSGLGSIPMPYCPGMGPIATAYPVATPAYMTAGNVGSGASYMPAGSPAAYTYAVRR